MEQTVMWLCARCNSIHPTDYKDGWGTVHGVGMGPTPVCTKLKTRPDGSGEVCRGELVPFIDQADLI